AKAARARAPCDRTCRAARTSPSIASLTEIAAGHFERGRRRARAGQQEISFRTHSRHTDAPRIRRYVRECCKVIHSFEGLATRAGFEAPREAAILIRARAHPL